MRSVTDWSLYKIAHQASPQSKQPTSRRRVVRLLLSGKDQEQVICRGRTGAWQQHALADAIIIRDGDLDTAGVRDGKIPLGNSRLPTVVPRQLFICGVEFAIISPASTLLFRRGKGQP